MSDSKFVRYFESDPKGAPGWRFRIEQEPGENAELVEEQVLPERVNTTAYRVLATGGHHWLTKADVKWLHETLGELLAYMTHE